jgi:uncharacterized protein (UPF0548 family)
MLTKPAPERISEFLTQQSGLSFSYSEVGASRDASPAGYDLDHNRIQLGAGQAVFDAACAALRRWEQFPRAWTEVHPCDAPLKVGVTVAVLFRVCGLWWMSSACIVYVIDESRPVRRFGFAYGTLPGHIERGEERFSIEWLADDTVWYDIRAFSRPRHWLARLGYPLARRLQRRFVLDSQSAMRRSVGLPCDFEKP